MTRKSIPSLVADLARLNLAYFRDADARNQVRKALSVGSSTKSLETLISEEERAVPAAAAPFARLTHDSLALAGIRSSGTAAAKLNVVIGQARSDGVFAGVRTALQAAHALAGELGLPMRVLMLDPLPAASPVADSAKSIAAVIDDPTLEVVAREDIRSRAYSTGDVWLATHYKTAHALQVACESGVIEVSRVGYLVQDYEPGFSAWSTDSVVAEATYRAGFVLIVNSNPLASYLRRQGHDVDPALVFAPAFPEAQLERTAAERRRTPGARVLFYARPRKQRNLYGLGVSAVKLAAERLGTDVEKVTFDSLGERHRPVALPNGAVLSSQGRLGWDEYFRYLSTVDVVLSLQQSPHPSHPPFDAAISGATAITNDFDGGRGAFHPRIEAVAADTTSLGDALAAAIRRSWDAEPGGYQAVEPGLLGRSLDDVVRDAARLLG